MDAGLAKANSLSREDFVLLFANVVEHCRVVAEQLCDIRPFESQESLLNGLQAVVHKLTKAQKEGVLGGHPDLAGKLADASLLTPESTREQKECGLDKLSPEERLRLRKHNDEYRDKFGFTFVICARENKAAAILAGLDSRLKNTREEELAAGMKEVGSIARLRAIDIITQLGQQALAKL